MKFTTLAYASVVALSTCISIVHSQPVYNVDLINQDKPTQVVQSPAIEKRYEEHDSSLESMPSSKRIRSKRSSKSLKSCYKKATLTQYWIPKEGDKDMLNDGETVTLSGSKNKALKSDSGSTIAKVSKTTYEKFQMEGTGLLKNGVMVNLGHSDSTFQKVDRSEAPYGLGSDDDIHLTPWVSVAANDLKTGTKLYIKELDGVKLPDGKTHNGCVRVDDEGWSFHGCQLDFFVLQFTAYQKLDKLLPEKVTVTAKDCKILNYVTDSVKKWAVINK